MPAVKVTTNTGTVSIGYDDLGRLEMDFGLSPPDVPGVLLSNIISMPYGVDNSNAYRTEWVQLITNASTTETISNSVDDITNYGLQTIGVVLDTQYPVLANSNRVWDSPTEYLNATNQIAATWSQQSEMWLMFTPNIYANWVPLWITTWSCTGTARGFGMNASNWTLTGTNISVLSSAEARTTYPIWTNNVKMFDTNQPP